MPQSATLLLTKTLTKADGRQGAERERAQEWSWPQGERQEEIAGLWLSHLLILFLKPT